MTLPWRNDNPGETEGYARLKTEETDKGQVILVAVGADSEEKRVEQLSDGTRDQLYLTAYL